MAPSGTTGPLFRSIRKGGRGGTRLTDQSVSASAMSWNDD
jgi:hypothetical protein